MSSNKIPLSTGAILGEAWRKVSGYRFVFIASMFLIALCACALLFFPTLVLANMQMESNILKLITALVYILAILVILQFYVTPYIQAYNNVNDRSAKVGDIFRYIRFRYFLILIMFIIIALPIIAIQFGASMLNSAVLTFAVLIFSTLLLIPWGVSLFLACLLVGRDRQPMFRSIGRSVKVTMSNLIKVIIVYFALLI